MEDEKKELKAEVIRDPEKFRSLLKILKESVALNKALESGVADSVVWRHDYTLSREGGEAIVEAFAEIEPRQSQEMQELRNYWISNYDSIERKVYHIAPKFFN